MKKQILSLALVAGAMLSVNAQSVYTSNGTLSSDRIVTMNGKYLMFNALNDNIFFDGTTGSMSVGSGFGEPVKFQVIKEKPLSGFVDNSFFGSLRYPSSGFMMPYHDGIFIQQRNNGANIRIRSVSPDFRRETVDLVHGGYIDFNSASTANTQKAAISFGSAETELMRINKDGKVRIASGTTDLPTPAGYRLFVDEGILTEKVKVALKTTADWADYVFASDYKLMPLSEVEKFTKENKHLPNVPSAEQMVEKGLNVAEMDAKLLEKIEELTLYLIEQQKQIEELKNEVKDLKSTK